jgi:hypothetical protein
MSLANLKAKTANTLQTLKQQAQQKGQSQKAEDSRFWKPTFDKEKGTGSAIIRFLPAPDGEDLPAIKIFSHGFKANGKWYIEKSRTTIGDRKDPVYVLNGKLYNSGIESDKAISKMIKRKPTWIANVLVVNDPAKPECNGKVFLYEFGPSIDEMLQAAMFPIIDENDVDPVSPIDVFNPWEGADFVIKMHGHKMPDGKGGEMLVPRYDKSSFKAPKAIGTDEEIEAIWKQTHSLQAFLDEKEFKSVADLSKRLLEVFGPTVGSGIPTLDGLDDLPEEEAPVRQKPAPAPQEQFDDVPDFPVQTKAPAVQSNTDDELAELAGLLDD